MYRLIPTSGHCLYSSLSPEQASPRHPMREWSHSLIVSRYLLNAISFGNLSLNTISKLATTHAHVLLFSILLSCFTFFKGVIQSTMLKKKSCVYLSPSFYCQFFKGSLLSILFTIIFLYLGLCLVHKELSTSIS